MRSQVTSGRAVTVLATCLGFTYEERLGHSSFLRQAGCPGLFITQSIRKQGQHLRVAAVFPTHRFSQVAHSTFSSLFNRELVTVQVADEHGLEVSLGLPAAGAVPVAAPAQVSRVSGAEPLHSMIL